MSFWSDIFSSSTPPDYVVGVGPVTTTTTASNYQQVWNQQTLNQLSQAAQMANSQHPYLGQNWQNVTNAPPPVRKLAPLYAFDLEHPAFSVKLEDLANMWTAKFGLDWVSPEDIDKAEDPKFYSLAAHRLVSSGYLEEHSLMDRYANVYRIIEK